MSRCRPICVAAAPENETGLATADPGWAPLHYSFAGVWEIDPHGLEEHAPEVQILDVHEPDEFTGPLGHIANAILIPLGELAGRARIEPRPPDRRCLPGRQPFGPGPLHL